MSPELPLTPRLPARFQGAASGLEELGEDAEEEEAAWKRMVVVVGGGARCTAFPSRPPALTWREAESSSASPGGPGQGVPAWPRQAPVLPRLRETCPRHVPQV